MFCIVEHFEIANFKAPKKKKELKIVKLYYINPKYLMQKRITFYPTNLYIYYTVYARKSLKPSLQ